MIILCFYVQMYIFVDKQNGIIFIKRISTCKKARRILIKKTTKYDRKMIVSVEMEKMYPFWC